MKILVTGTAGFIGYHLAKKLIERGDEVIGLDNINNYYNIDMKYARLSNLGINKNIIKEKKIVTSNKYSNHRFIKLDLCEDQEFFELLKNEKFDGVCHLAAQAGVRYSLENPNAYIHSNIKGFLNILEGCKNNNINNLCYASSSSVYGLNQSQPFKTSDCADHPVSLYAATKKSNELMAHVYSSLYKIPTTGLRFFTVYGPWGRPDMAPMLFADSIINNKPIRVFNNGNMTRDFTYIDDIINGIIKVIDKPARPNEMFDPIFPDSSSSSAPYKIYNIGNSSPIKLMDFISTLENEIGVKAKMNFIEMQLGDVESTFADISPLTRELDYTPNVNLEEGIYQFIKWYREYMNY